MPGIPLAEFEPHTRELLFELGRALGEIDRELSALNRCPAAKRDLRWDLDRADILVRDSLASFANQAAKADCLRTMLERYELISGRLAGLPRSVIHNDANDYNVLVHHDTERGLALLGLIDFGDLMMSTTINELAICAAYCMLGKSNPMEALLALSQGYHQARHLSEQEISVVFPLIGMRLAQSVCISAAQRRLRPDNDYLSISEEPAWELLGRLAEIDPAEVHLRLTDACSHTTSFGRPTNAMEPERLLRERQRYVGPSLSLSYAKPLNIVRGKGQYLFDQSDVTYLDCVNNVCHVGHCHPRVIAAAHRQMQQLNTNTRYLHENLVTYAKRLVETLPPPLEVCYLVNSGSEANDLALRMARVSTNRPDVAVIDHAYHGHTASLIEISPYKFSRSGGDGKPPHVHVLPCPDGYRGAYRYDDADYPSGYAVAAADVLDAAENSGRSIGAMFAESLLGCGGQISLPPGYLKSVFAKVRALGGVCIADEVQVGFGRVGTHFWGFQTQEVVPDIVTMGKPIGNGHPLAAVVTTREIADAFNNGMEYFNTFGGNPVSAAVGIAVLDVIAEERLQQHALAIGDFLLKQWAELQRSFPVVGDVRGSGFFLGLELVRDPESRQPHRQLAKALVEQMKHRRILLSVDGPSENVIKFKPPMVFSQADAERLVHTMTQELSRLMDDDSIQRTN